MIGNLNKKKEKNLKRKSRKRRSGKKELLAKRKA